MRALKNDCTGYVEKIQDEINCCYAQGNPTNSQLMELYGFIGKNICEQGEKAFVVYLTKILAGHFPQLKGFSPRNLRRMRDFYKTYQTEPKLMKKAQNLSWTQNTVILECCENNEQRSFYLNLAKENNLSKLALMKAIKEETFERALTVETPIETESNCCPGVANLCNTEDLNTTEHTKNDCRAFVTRCELFRQGIGVSKMANKAFRYIRRLKIDFCYLKVICYEKSSLSIRSLIERLGQKVKCYPPPQDIAVQNQIPMLLLT